MDDPWEKLLETAKKVHLANNKLQDFCPFPKDLKKQEFEAFHIPASDLMQNFHRNVFAFIYDNNVVSNEVISLYHSTVF